jgi:hypothetical protein
MGTFAAGQVVLVQFPFSDLSAVKLRPAVVLASVIAATGFSVKSPAIPMATCVRYGSAQRI